MLCAECGGLPNHPKCLLVGGRTQPAGVAAGRFLEADSKHKEWSDEHKRQTAAGIEEGGPHFSTGGGHSQTAQPGLPILEDAAAAIQPFEMYMLRAVGQSEAEHHQRPERSPQEHQRPEEQPEAGPSMHPHPADGRRPQRTALLHRHDRAGAGLALPAPGHPDPHHLADEPKLQELDPGGPDPGRRGGLVLQAFNKVREHNELPSRLPLLQQHPLHKLPPPTPPLQPLHHEVHPMRQRLQIQ